MRPITRIEYQHHLDTIEILKTAYIAICETTIDLWQPFTKVKDKLEDIKNDIRTTRNILSTCCISDNHIY